MKFIRVYHAKLLCNIIEPVGFDDISNGDLEELSKSFTGGRRHAIGTTDNNTISLTRKWRKVQLCAKKQNFLAIPNSFN